MGAGLLEKQASAHSKDQYLPLYFAFNGLQGFDQAES